jgi:hypothetical protein
MFKDSPKKPELKMAKMDYLLQTYHDLKLNALFIFFKYSEY